MIQINYRDTRPFYQQIKDNVRHLVVSGALKKDDKLPSVRELAASLAINPNTIQRAYRELENEGYIYTLPGKGTFAAEMDHTNQIRQLTFPPHNHAVHSTDAHYPQNKPPEASVPPDLWSDPLSHDSSALKK